MSVWDDAEKDLGSTTSDVWAEAEKSLTPAAVVPPVKPTFSSRIKSFLSNLTPGPAETPLSILGAPATAPKEKPDPVAAAERLKLDDAALAEYLGKLKGIKPDAVTQQDIEEQRIADRKVVPQAKTVEQSPIPASADLLSAPQAPAPVAPVAAPDVTAVAPPAPAEPDVFDQAAQSPAAPQDLTNVDARPPESVQQQPVLQYDPGLVELLGNTGKQFAHGATAGMVGHTEQGEQGLAGPFAEMAGNLVGAGVSEAVAPLIGPAVFGAISDVKSQIENEGLDLKDVSAVRAAVNGAFTAALFKVPMVLGRDALTKAVTGAGVGTGFSVANVMADQLVKQGKIDFTDPEWSEQYKQAIKYGIPIGLAAAAGSHAKVPDLVVKAHEEATAPKATPETPVVAPEVPKVEAPVEEPAPESPVEAPAPPATTSTRNLTAPLPRELSGAKSRYNIGQDSYLPQFESDIDKALYITSQKTKSRADQKYRDYLTDQVGLTNAEIDEIGPRLRENIKALAKASEPGDLHVPSFAETVLGPEVVPETAAPVEPVLPKRTNSRKAKAAADADRVPMLGGGDVSRERFLEAHKAYEEKYKTGQSPERIIQRGGFSEKEIEDLIGKPKTLEVHAQIAQTPENPIESGAKLGENLPPKSPSTPLITPEAEDIIRKADQGFVPTMSKQLKIIAHDNGIEVTDKTTPQDVVAELRRQATETEPVKEASAPEAPTTEAAPPEPVRPNSTPSTPFGETPDGIVAAPEPNERPTGARKSLTSADRADYGLNELPSPQRKSWRDALDAAKEENLDADADRLSEEIIANPRPMTEKETAGAVIRLKQLKDQYNAAHDRLKSIDDPTLIDEQARAIDSLRSKIDKVTEALQSSGTEKGRNLAAQKLAIDKNFDLASVEVRAKAAKKAPLTDAERETFKTTTDKLAAAEKQIADLQSRSREVEARDSITTSKRTKKLKPQEVHVRTAELASRARRLLRAGCHLS